ncbi:hypothetical protein ACFLU8_03590 [Chloroflexota bacterium]
MWKLKGCNRCGGDLLLDQDLYGFQEQCLQCGYDGDLESMDEFRKQKAEEEEREKQIIRL